MSNAEILGVLGFALSLILAAARLFEFFDNRVRLKATAEEAIGYYADSQQEDRCYELLLTNMGAKSTTVTRIIVYPYARRGPFRDLGQGEVFVSDELGLSHVTLKPGETRKFDFPFHQLNFSLGREDENVKADGQLCRVYHTAAWQPQNIVLR